VVVAAPILLAVAGAVAVAAPQRGASVGEVFEVLEGREAPFAEHVLVPPPQLSGRPGPKPPGSDKAIYGERMDNHLDSANFTIAWADGQATRGDAEDTAAGMEAAWQALVEEQGWTQPISSDRYLLWVILESDVDYAGYTTYYWTDDYPDRYPAIYLNTDYAQHEDWWQSACAHELAHALQQAIRERSGRYESWYWEASAVWMEELARPELDQYGWVSEYYVEEAHRRYDSTTNSHEYGMFLLNAYIEEHLTGAGGLLSIWQHASEHQGDDWAEVLEGALGLPPAELWAGFVNATIAGDLAESRLYSDVEHDGDLYDGLEGCVAVLGTEYYRMPRDGTVTVEARDEGEEFYIAGPEGWGTTLALSRGDIVGVLTPVEPSAGYFLWVEFEEEPVDTGDWEESEDWYGSGGCGCAAGSGSQGLGWWLWMVSSVMVGRVRRTSDAEGA
jgi:hypothetical protein